MITTFIHLITFLAIIFPLFFIVGILKNERGRLTNSFKILFFGVLPLAVYHLLEFLVDLDINLLPKEGTLFYIILHHTIVIIAFISLGIFLYFFKKNYMNPIYKIMNNKKKI